MPKRPYSNSSSNSQEDKSREVKIANMSPSSNSTMMSSPAPQKSVKDLHTEASNELSSLGRVGHKLAMTEAGQMEKVLNLLLPRLLTRIGSNQRRISDLKSTITSSPLSNANKNALENSLKALYDSLHAKLVEMLSHIMKRARADHGCKLPCAAILEILYDSKSQKANCPTSIDPFTMNLSLAFLTMGLPRYTKREEMEPLLPGLFSILGTYSIGGGESGGGGGLSFITSPARKNQINQIGHLVIRAVHKIVRGNAIASTGLKSSSSTISSSSSKQPPSASLKGTKNDLSVTSAATTAIEQDDYITIARNLCCTDTSIGQTLYSLILDVLLYQPMTPSNSNSTTGTSSSSIPPPGLSQWGNERLKSGASIVEKSWAAEFAIPVKLRDLKMALLEFIAPCRRWDIFNGAGKEMSNSDGVIVGSGDTLTIARSVALMVVTSGDQHVDVADRASSYLKSHLESLKNTTTATTTTADAGSNSHSSDENKNATKRNLLGEPISLACELLTLVLGDIVSTNATSSISKRIEYFPHSLGLTINEDPSSTQSDINRAAIMSTKRRMVSETNATAVLNFIRIHLLENSPRIFLSYLDAAANMKEEEQSWEKKFRKSCSAAVLMGTLVLTVTKNYIGTGRSLSGSSFTNSNNNPRVVTGRLLNAICVRLVSLYDSVSKEIEEVETSMDDNDNDDTLLRTRDELRELLTRSLNIACSIVSIASSHHSGDVSNRVGIEIRDSCYGVWSSIFRCSRLVIMPNSGVFSCGEQSSSPSTLKDSKTLTSLSTATAVTLFGCVSNEHETLRPRSVAALDSLLAAYLTVIEKFSKSKDPVETGTDQSIQDNPWASITKKKADETLLDNLVFTGLTKAMQTLLWNIVQGAQPKASRFAAAQWANDILKPLDKTNASHILCFLAGDSDSATSAFAKEGLGIKLGEITVQISNDSSLPDFRDISSILFSNLSSSSSSWPPSYFDFSARGQGAVLRFSLKCLLNDLYSDEDEPLRCFVTVICISLKDFIDSNGNASSRKGQDSIELLEEASICLGECLRVSAIIRQNFVDASFALNHEQLGDLCISANSSKARKHLAGAYGYLADDLTLWHCQNPEIDLEQWLQNCQIGNKLERCSLILGKTETRQYLKGQVHGVAMLGSICIRSLRLHSLSTFGKEIESNKCWELSSSILSDLGLGLAHDDEVVGKACADALTLALSYSGPDAPVLQEQLYGGVLASLKHLHAALKKYGNGDHAEPNRATSLCSATGVLLAASTVRSNAGDNTVQNELSASRLHCVDALFQLLGSTSSRKDPELSLAVGDALAKYADAYSPKGSTWTNPSRSLPSEYDSEYANELPPHAQVIYTLLHKEIKATSPHKRSACPPVMLIIVGRATKMVNEDPSELDRAFHKEVLKNLTAFQAAFLQLLADPKSKQLARESCCLGLAACRGLSVAATCEEDVQRRDQLMNERLLLTFGQPVNHGNSALMETRDQNMSRRQENGSQTDTTTQATEDVERDAEVGSAAGIGEAALGAFREMAGAAVALGRPDILYSLMILSVTLPIWTTGDFRGRFTGRSLLGNEGGGVQNNEEMRQALNPHLPNLIPRLLRACNDPNKQTREQMTALWMGLTGSSKEARALINEHLLITIDTLIDDATNKLWRARVGACAALAEIIVGRSWEDLGGGNQAVDEEDLLNLSSNDASSRILRLFKLLMRSLDDVRLPVRENGEILARCLKSLVVRLCDPSSDQEKEIGVHQRAKNSANHQIYTTVASSTILPWLVKYGLNQPCAEASGFSISCLLGIVEVAKPTTLEPVLPDLVGALLLAMSGLEPAALNYLQVRAAGQDSNSNGAAGYERLERVRLQMALNGPVANALTKCLDMFKVVSLETQKAIIPQLDSAIRCGAGFATRAAAADAVSSLAHMCPLSFQFKGISATNPTVRLLRALYFASEKEHGSNARDKMTHALGNLAAIAPGSSVRQLALRACSSYNHATGSNDDIAARRAAAATLRSIATRASNQFTDGGPNDIWCRRILPIAFMGQREEGIGSLWKDVWEEGGQATNLSDKVSRSFDVNLQEKLLPFLVKNIVDALNDVSWQRRKMACAALTELADHQILAPSPRSIESRSETSPDSILRAKRRAKASKEVLFACTNLIVRTRTWGGKEELMKATSKVAGNWAPCGCVEEKNPQDVYGWTQEGNDTCPWAPIVHKCNSWNDLFLGDNFFIQNQHRNDLDGKTNNIIDDVLPDTKEDVAVQFDEAEDSIDQIDESKIDTQDEENSDSDSLVSNHLTFSGLCRVFAEQGIFTSRTSTFYEIDALPYRAEALQSLEQLLNSITGKNDTGSVEHQKFLYDNMASHFISVLPGKEIFQEAEDSSDDLKIPPIIVARSMKCLSAAIWEGISKISHQSDLKSDPECLVKLILINCGRTQPAWTVREAGALAAGNLVLKVNPSSLQKLQFVENLLECTTLCVKDKKFWRVRYAGLSLLLNLCNRAGDGNMSSKPMNTGSNNESALVLEALLPYKERIIGIARTLLTDNESKVTAIASDICNLLAWWP